ncbi:secreted protein with altered thrombospondin repeat domain [Hepatocystis sp. ex Piliocolobus tephrosceles]|nr:secreted protein with altered thrombospondin repeat domain [Hepatocystis sp. ex Piliocolobus tephrosceles]
MKKYSLVLLLYFLIFLIQYSALQFSNKIIKKKSLENTKAQKHVEPLHDMMHQDDMVPRVDGDTCVIFAASEGDKNKCWCPRGYIMCSEEDVKHTQENLNKIENINERNERTPQWLKRLCDHSFVWGFNNMSIVIDFELAVLCKDESNKYKADFEITAASGYIPFEQVKNNLKADPTYTARMCSVNDFYLCRKVENDNVNCLYSDWTEWSKCVDNKQKRTRKVLRSNQNNNNLCLWNNKQINNNIIHDVRPCDEAEVL